MAGKKRRGSNEQTETGIEILPITGSGSPKGH
jgi:hypothetical protein